MKKLIIFYGEWCGPCKTYEPVYEKFAKDNNVEIKKVDIASNEFANYVTLGISSVPTTLVVNGFDEGSIVHDIKYGPLTEHELKRLIE